MSERVGFVRRSAALAAALLFLFCLTALLPACSSDPPPPEVVMFGDSMTYYGSWPELLREYYPRIDAVPGETTRFMLDRLDKTIDAAPKAVPIMAGINDIRIGMSTDQIMANYRKMVRRLKAAGITPVVQSTIYVAQGFENPRVINPKVDELNKALRAMCKEEDLVYLDLNKLFSSGGLMKTEYSRDGIHPNDKAYAVWAEKLRPVLAKVFGKEG